MPTPLSARLAPARLAAVLLLPLSLSLLAGCGGADEDCTPPNFFYGTEPGTVPLYTLVRGEAIQPIVPFDLGAMRATWTIEPALPAGLVLDDRTGHITGTPTSASPQTWYTVHARHECGAGQARLRILVDFGALALTAPLPGRDGVDWVVQRYVDLDPTPTGLEDYTGAVDGAARTTDGHTGTDFHVPSFRAMDADVPVLAADAGRVVAVFDDDDDRNVACEGTAGNFVTIEHPNGWRTTYAHLKRDAVVVTVGQHVLRRQQIGVVGSSGCSTHPHVHLEVRDDADAVVDPFAAGLWRRPPPYDAPLTVMESQLHGSAIADFDTVKDPPADIERAQQGSVVGVGLSTAHGAVGTTIEVRWIDGAGALAGTDGTTLQTAPGHALWFWNRTVQGTPGTWQIEILVDGTVAETRTLEVR